MIEFVRGNLFEADAEALVNTVNTVGVMGKGLALQFKQAYPDNYKAYRAACKRGEVQIGRMVVFGTKRLVNPRYIVNFPTKQHWKSNSRLEDIEAGLRDLVTVVRERGIRSLAIPALGCKNGGLDWEDVRPRIEAALAELPNVLTLVYPPGNTPDAETMPVATIRPRMTPGRAAVIGLMHQYGLPGYHLTMLEIQKLTYFLQGAGEPLRLKFSGYHYGPYAENLQHVLQHIEGHYIRGYGDRSRSAAIRLLDGAVEEAEAFLKDYPDTHQRLQQVAQLIDGFETPYSLELLATIHWLAHHKDPTVHDDVQAAVRGFQTWNARKRQVFRAEHIQIAWEQLREQHWIGHTVPIEQETPVQNLA